MYQIRSVGSQGDGGSTLLVEGRGGGWLTTLEVVENIKLLVHHWKVTEDQINLYKF